jgi:hypothetical protein
MLKNLHWKPVMVFSIAIMLTGFLLSVWGLENQNHNISMVGITIMVVVSIAWWLWVMLVIKKMIGYTNTAISRALEIRKDLKKISRMVDSNLRPKDK